MCDEYYWFLWQILFYHWHRKCDIFDKQGGEADQLPGPGMRVSQGHPWDNHWIISHGLCEKRQASHFPPIWVWVNTYRYIFSGMNIHLPAILGFNRYQGFDPSPFEDMWIGYVNHFLKNRCLQVKLQMRLPVFLAVEDGDSTDSLETPLGLPWDSLGTSGLWLFVMTMQWQAAHSSQHSKALTET